MGDSDSNIFGKYFHMVEQPKHHALTSYQFFNRYLYAIHPDEPLPPGIITANDKARKSEHGPDSELDAKSDNNPDVKSNNNETADHTTKK